MGTFDLLQGMEPSMQLTAQSFYIVLVVDVRGLTTPDYPYIAKLLDLDKSSSKIKPESL